MGHTGGAGLEERRSEPGVQREAMGPLSREGAERGGDIGNAWSDAVWIPCRDGKLRAIQGATESLPEPLVDGTSPDLGSCSHHGVQVYSPLIEKGEGRIMRLRGYGNAIVAQAAMEFIKSYLETETETGKEPS